LLNLIRRMLMKKKVIFWLSCFIVFVSMTAYAGPWSGGGSGSGAGTITDADSDGAADLANYLKSVATTGKISITGPAAGSTRAKTLRDADDTILELGGSYTPTGTWVWTSATVTWPTNLATFNGIALSTDMQALLGSANYATARTNLGLAIGTNVQAYSTILAGLAGVTPVKNGIFGYNNDETLGLYANHSHDDSTAQFYHFESNAACTAASTPWACCSGAGAGTCDKGTARISTNSVTSGKVAKIEPVCTGDCTLTTESYGAGTYTFVDKTSTQTLTGKTYTVSNTEFVPVAWMIDGAAKPADIATTDLGTRQVKTRKFQADTADQDLEMFWQAPVDIVDGDGGTAGFQVKWRPIFVITEATAPASGEGVAFALQSCSVGSGDAGDCTVGTASVIADADLDAHVQYDIVYGDWTVMTVTDGAAGEAWMMKLYRDQDNAIDDYVQPVGLIGIEIKYVKNMTNGY
jgi:hypothetical protein